MKRVVALLIIVSSVVILSASAAAYCDCSTLADADIGELVKINISGVPRDFIVIQQGRPSSSLYNNANYENGTILLMNELSELNTWHSSTVNDYQNSRIHGWLNNEFLAMLDAGIKSQIKQVRIPFRPGSGTAMTVNSGVNGLLSSAFLLSSYEVGFDQSIIATIPIDGALFSWFLLGDDIDSLARIRRIANFNGTDTHWWLRSPHTGSALNPRTVNRIGGAASTNPTVETVGVRPAIVFPNTLKISSVGELTTECECEPPATEPPTTETTEPPTATEPQEPGEGISPELAGKIESYIDYSMFVYERILAAIILGIFILVSIAVYKLFRIFF